MQQSNVVPLFASGTTDTELLPAEHSSDAIAQVFENWKRISGHTRARMDTARQRVIRARLKDGYTVADLELACYGCKFSAFHQGENDRGERYDSITLILRDADHVERFIALAERVIAGMQRRAQQQAEQPAQPTAAERNPEAFRKFLEDAAKAGIRLRGKV